MPIFSGKLRWLVGEIRGRIQLLIDAEEPSFIKRYVLYRDLAFFLCIWWAGDRAADLGRTRTCDATRIDGRDLLFHHTIGKTIREGNSALIIIPKLENWEMDPVRAVDEMVNLASSNGFDLQGGSLFRPSPPDRRSLANKPFVGNGPNNRLKLYFSVSSDQRDQELRAHGGRARVAVTLRLLGATEQQIMDHCGWATSRMFKHYTEIERVSRRCSTVRMLQEAVDVEDDGQASRADLAGHVYQLLNSGFKAEPAFRTPQE